ncbi:hypothetical protein PV08_11347 [Exophiala spinifera]|uniref:Zn(2)-C6 fungal-type domain-containing protein n=1 Tax=Exophiala spinifera TaxID=91928 RepID=A0A0D2AV90_9EURO|nr:uncharacterized protein PV08_11347 [Exophiala spinifera]KIW10385.1 hypothetical protein PV08_11347 [Exophiala spinifera]
MPFPEPLVPIDTSTMPREPDLEYAVDQGTAFPDIATQEAQNVAAAARSTRTATKHTSRACTSCRKRRRKCDGDQGGGRCSECVKHNFECVLDANTDLRRKLHREKARKDQQLLHQVLATLRDRSDGRAETLLHLISTDAPLAALQAHLAQADPEETVAFGWEAQPDTQQPQSSSIQPALARSTSLRALLNPLTPQQGRIRERGQQRGYSLGEQNIAFISNPTDIVNPSEQQPRFPSSGDNYVEPGAVRSFGNLPMSSAIRSNGWAPHVQQQQLNLFHKPQYSCAPLLLDDPGVEDPLSISAHAFIDDARSLIAQGVPARTILSMDGLQTELFFRDRQPGDGQTVSTWVCEFTKAWRGMLPNDCLYTTLYMVACFMRWMVMPCKETWLMMPELMRPLLDQMVVPHHKLFVDLCHIPQLRKSFLTYNRDFTHVLRPDTFNPHWSFGDDKCVEPIGGTRLEHRSRLTDEFISHISKPQNWTLHSSVLAHFPDLSDQIGFHDGY